MIWSNKEADRLIEECNKGSTDACNEVFTDFDMWLDGDKRSDITNQYLIEKLEKKDEIERQKALAEKRAEELATTINLCKKLLKEQLKDPDSFKELNSITAQVRTGTIRYSATNSFGGRVQQTFKCFEP